MDDKTRALLGDREAAKRLTDAGVLLPCAHCGGEAKFKKGFPSRQIAHCRQAVVQCKSAAFGLLLTGNFRWNGGKT